VSARALWRPLWRRLRLGLPTLLGLPPRGFFIPYRHARELPAPGTLPPYPAFERWFERHQPAFAQVLAWIDGYRTELLAFGQLPPPEPRWQQDWFPRLDGAAAYTLVRRLAPRRIVEVGSGHSTRFLLRAIRDQGLATEVTAIDPAPRAEITRLPLRHLACPVQQAGLAPFQALEPGDLLFIDSSHVGQPGTDVDFLFNRVIPTLPAGTLIHLHDLRLPDDYPAEWAWRGYNEQQLAASLLASGGFTPLFASHYSKTRLPLPPTIHHIPLPPNSHETSLWLRKLAPALG